MTSLATCALTLSTLHPLDASVTVAAGGEAMHPCGSLGIGSARGGWLDLDADMVAYYVDGATWHIGQLTETVEVRKAIGALRELSDGWHGKSSRAPSEQVLHNAQKMALTAVSAGLRVPEITPNPHGTVSLEWETVHGTLHLEIGKRRLSGYLRTPGNRPTLIAADGGLDLPYFKSVSALLFPSNAVSVRFGVWNSALSLGV